MWNPPAGFEVHLDVLRGFARQLYAHAGVLETHHADLVEAGVAAARPALLGDFAEAESLAGAHAAVLHQLDALYRRVHGLVGWASGTAADIARAYSSGDGRASEDYRSLARDGGPR